MPDDPASWTRPRVAAGALFFDTAGRVLLVRPSYKDSWDIPGGYVNQGETPHDACVREIQEELGLEVSLGQLLVADWAPHPTEGDKLLFIFDAGQLDPERESSICLQADELEEYAFFAPEEVHSLLVSRLARRVGAALEARVNKRATLYLEHGRQR